MTGPRTPESGTAPLPADLPLAVDRRSWTHLQPGAQVEVTSVRGNRRRGLFQGMAEEGVLLLVEPGKANPSRLRIDQLQSLELLSMVPGTQTESWGHLAEQLASSSSQVDPKTAPPGTVVTGDTLALIPQGSRLELTSVRGNCRTGIFRGLHDGQDMLFVPDGEENVTLYPRSQLHAAKLLAAGPEQVALQGAILGQLRSEFESAALAFASHAGELRGIIVVEVQSGRLLEVRRSGLRDRDTLTWDESGNPNPDLAEFTVVINMEHGTYQLRANAFAEVPPRTEATLRQCLADYVRELTHKRPARASRIDLPHSPGPPEPATPQEQTPS